MRACSCGVSCAKRYQPGRGAGSPHRRRQRADICAAAAALRARSPGRRKGRAMTRPLVQRHMRSRRHQSAPPSLRRAELEHGGRGERPAVRRVGRGRSGGGGREPRAAALHERRRHLGPGARRSAGRRPAGRLGRGAAVGGGREPLRSGRAGGRRPPLHGRGRDVAGGRRRRLPPLVAVRGQGSTVVAATGAPTAASCAPRTPAPPGRPWPTPTAWSPSPTTARPWWP
jgi:hypothetical protein